MEVVKLPQTDVIATAPGCFDLPMAQAVIMTDKTQPQVCLITCWELSDEELEEVKKNKRIYLRLHTAQTPPVAMEVWNPFERYTDIVTLKEAVKILEPVADAGK